MARKKATMLDPIPMSEFTKGMTKSQMKSVAEGFSRTKTIKAETIGAKKKK